MLDEDAVDEGVRVELVDLCEEFFLGGFGGGFPRSAFHSGGFGPLSLHADIGKARGVLGGDDGFESGGDAFFFEDADALFQLRAELFRQGEAIKDLGGHFLL